MDFIETEGKTVEEAIDKACEELNLPEEKLNIEIVSESSSGLFGLMGIKKAKIKASIKEDQEDNKLDFAKKTLEEILVRLKTDATVDAKEFDDRIHLNINGDGSGLLIGRRGQTLDALQHIVDKIVNRFSDDRRRIIIDTERYRERRIESLENLALRIGEQVKKLGKPVSITPLNAHDRRIIHMTLQNDNQLTTRSKGDGHLRRIVVSTKRARNLNSHRNNA
ncbi:MAG: RNA-binding cell elongation regulator Jag/EloR [Thermodesulfobacteriota bacterium]|nr:RNA-binding cell elongation regulator Jag/EloR [Thermodesulfobacteriota bacterium]